MPSDASPLRFVLVEGDARRPGEVTRSPFVIGRMPGCDLVLTDTFASRRHAEIVLENGEYSLVDQNSRHGTFVNGQRIAGRQLLRKGDSIRFGSPDGPLLQIEDERSSSTLRDLMAQMPEVGASSSGLEKLRWFFESARKLTTYGAVDQILAALVETTLQLTQMERGFVFLRTASGEMELAVGRGCHGESFVDDSTLSHGAMRRAVSTASDYILTDTANAESQTDSIVLQSIRSVICIPLRKRRLGVATEKGSLLGLLYLDSRLRPGSFTEIDQDLLKTIATDASALIDNAQLALAEESERHYREELNIAAGIQRSLMPAETPEFSYARIAARSVPCREVGGDFFDVVVDEEGFSIVIADVSGKGISAAILASTLQGMLYSQLTARQPLHAIAEAANRYICSKRVGKYATLVILRLTRDGVVQFINCGHVHPFLCSAEGWSRITASNQPVGLMEDASFEAITMQLAPGTRMLVVTDGVTEAEDITGEFFGEERLAASAAQCIGVDEIYAAVQSFCGSVPANDDITMLEVQYTG